MPMASNWNIPSDYANEVAYAIGDQATFNGVVYEATAAISDINTTDPREDGGVNWKVAWIVNIEDAYGIWNSISIALNRTDDDDINGSIWMFMQQANYALNRVLRSPAMKVTRDFIVDSNTRFAPPTDLLQVESVRIKSDQGTQYTLQGRGNIECLAAVNRSDLIEQQETIRRDGTLYADDAYSNPYYWYDRDFFYIVDGLYESGTEVEMTYYAAEAVIGDTLGELNADFEPINSEGQNESEWVEDGNELDDFVQATVLITTNIYTSQFPHLLKLGALVAAEDYVNDPERSIKWKLEYKESLAEAQDEISRFESNRPYNVELFNSYS